MKPVPDQAVTDLARAQKKTRFLVTDLDVLADFSYSGICLYLVRITSIYTPVITLVRKRYMAVSGWLVGLC